MQGPNDDDVPSAPTLAVSPLGSAATLPLGEAPTVAPDTGARTTPLATALTEAQNAVLRDGSERAGDTVGGYVLQRRVGAGGMGVVWEAHDPELDRVVALKLTRGAAPELRERFEREVRITARLQHPSIVNIFEAGIHQGEPYYVMKLVRGESLDRTLAARSTLEARLALLPHVIAVVDALAYAHDQHVIHRDLKPDNVLVGEFGEAVVIDWGLAKSVSDKRPSAPVLATTSESTGAETEIGAVLGTPMYMPPEQARGEPADARSDVYALGAILYHLLAGERPYAGERNVVAAVIAGPPASLPAGTPPDLATIVEKAMSRDPSTRYATAKALADDLKRFQTGQLVASHRYSARQLMWRWIRRHRAATSVGAIAAVALATVGIVSVNRIAKQRTIAQQRTVQANELLDFMVFDLRDKLKDIGRLDLLDTVARRASAYVLADTSETPDALHRQEAMLANLGNVLEDQGDSKGALDSYQRALALSERLVKLEPSSRFRRRSLAVGHTNVGDVQLTLGNHDQATAEYNIAAEIDQALASSPDATPAEILSFATDHEKLGDVHIRRDRKKEAYAERKQALDIVTGLAATHPDDVTVQRALVQGHGKVGATLIDTDPAAAATEYRAALAVLDQLVVRDPRNHLYQSQLAGFRNNLGIVLAHQGKAREAIAEYRISLEMAQRLAAADPTNTDRQRDVSATHENIADSLLDLHEAEAAVVEYQAGLDIALALATRDPNSDAWKRDLAKNHYKLGAAYLELRRYAEVATQYRAALEVAESALRKNANDSDWKETAEQLRSEIAKIPTK